MKKSWIIILSFLGIFLMGSIVSLHAAPYSVLFDEFGTGYYRDLGIAQDTWHVWNGALRDDPTRPGLQSLIYIGLRTGGDWAPYRDVLARDQTGADSDIVRFYDPNTTENPNQNQTWVIFYSSDTSGGSLADTNGLPGTRNVIRTVTENSDGTFSWA